VVEVTADEVPVTLESKADVSQDTAQGSHFYTARKGSMTGPAVQEDSSERLQLLRQGIRRLKRDIEDKAQKTLEKAGVSEGR
jgi:hypothetical protein